MALLVFDGARRLDFRESGEPRGDRTMCPHTARDRGDESGEEEESGLQGEEAAQEEPAAPPEPPRPADGSQLVRIVVPKAKIDHKVVVRGLNAKREMEIGASGLPSRVAVSPDPGGCWVESV